MKLVAMTFLVVLTLSVSGRAQGERRDCRRGINERQVNQQYRIRQGIRNDELTRLEVARLERQQANVAFAEARFRNSGDAFTARERARIQSRLNLAGRNIYRQKHDDQDRDR
jgi:hypothetical protein